MHATSARPLRGSPGPCSVDNPTMFRSITALFITSTLLASTLTVTAQELQEYCQYETFEASCGPDEVIMMNIARYGRMRIGRCVKTDFGFLGCYTNVLKLLDKYCSGRRTCSVPVIDPTFGNRRPCNQEFKNYLETSYECVKVITPNGSCRSAKRIRSPPPDSVISSLVTEETGCGLPNTPYILEVPSGQTINLTLLDFHVIEPDQKLGQDLGLEIQPLGCDVYTTLKEPKTGRAVDVCGGRERHNIVFVSRTNIVEVIIHTTLPSKQYFLLKYEVLGCQDVPTPPGSWTDRRNDRLTIYCNSTQQVWQLRCQGNSWIGQMGNCSLRVDEEGDLAHLAFDVMSLPPAILIAIVAGIACLISFVILMMGVYYFRRKGQRRHRHSKPSNMMGMTCASEDIVGRGCSDTYQQQREPIYESRQACTVCSREMTSLSNCDYAYMWDSPNSKPRRLKYDKLYSAGIYGPLNCKCVPVKLQELDIRDSQCPPTVTSPDNIRDPGSSHVTFCELDPDVVRTLDRTYGNELQFATEMKTLGTFKDDVGTRNTKDNLHFSA